MTSQQDQQIAFYKTDDSVLSLNVSIQDETIWLTQEQMGRLFEKGKATISEHIRNIFKEGELEHSSTVRKFRTVQMEGERQVNRQLEHYSLDVVISVGYRVKSKRGTQFRIWANSVLKEHLLQGYTLNKAYLEQKTEKLQELASTVNLLSAVLETKQLSQPEAVGLLKVISDYNYALDLLNQYDHELLEIQHVNDQEVVKITYEEAVGAIDNLRKQLAAQGEPTALFGREKDSSFQGSLYSIYQTFDGQDLYASIEEKAARLLYSIIKTHAFVDGNKRIGAFLFVWFLERNGCLYASDGRKRIEDNTLVAICLMVAQSTPHEVELMVKLVVNLINKKS